MEIECTEMRGGVGTEKKREGRLAKRNTKYKTIPETSKQIQTALTCSVCLLS